MSQSTLRCLVAVWAAVVIGSVFAVAAYDATPGMPAALLSDGVRASAIETGDQPRLLMFLHPKCNCSMASLSELSQLMARHRSAISVSIILLQTTETDTWQRTDAWLAASKLTDVRIVPDKDGAIARRFDAQTSGQVFLLAADGHLLFSGGITGSRGHVGENAGFNAVEQAILEAGHGRTAPTAAPVYGCALFDDLGLPQTISRGNR